MTALTRDQILQAQDSRTETVPVPEWGGDVIVRNLSGTERDQFEAGIMEQDKKGTLRMRLANARSKLVVAAAVDSDGKQLFTETDISALGAKNAKALQRVYDAAAELSGLKDEDLEELVGNSEAAQSGASTSDSPSLSAVPSKSSSHESTQGS